MFPEKTETFFKKTWVTAKSHTTDDWVKFSDANASDKCVVAVVGADRKGCAQLHPMTTSTQTQALVKVLTNHSVGPASLVDFELGFCLGCRCSSE